MKRISLVVLLAMVCLVGHPTPARADLTGFLGFTTTPENRAMRGFAFGINVLVLGFEFEYANTVEDMAGEAPGLRTGMLSGLVQTPTSDVQFYLAAGGGFYRERFGDQAETSIGTNIGGGVKVALAGPIRLRVDYRIFSLRGSPLYPTPKRLYAGLNVAF